MILKHFKYFDIGIYLIFLQFIKQIKFNQMIRLQFYRGLIAAALTAINSLAIDIAKDDFLDDTAYLLSQSSADADTSSMTGVLSSIAAYSMADAKAATGVETHSSNELASKVVANLHQSSNARRKMMEKAKKRASDNAKK